MPEPRVSLIERLRAQPPHVRQFVVSAVLGTLGLTSLVVWWTVGLGSVAVNGPLAAPGSTASIIEQKTAEQVQRQTSGSANATAPLAGQSEQPDGILYLGARYRAHDVTIVLDRVEFFPSATRAYLTIANESTGEIKADLSKSSYAQQLPGTGGELSFDAHSTASTSVPADGQAQVSLSFAPANGRTPFTLTLGDFVLAGTTWQATFSVDPATIVKK